MYLNIFGQYNDDSITLTRFYNYFGRVLIQNEGRTFHSLLRFFLCELSRTTVYTCIRTPSLSLARLFCMTNPPCYPKLCVASDRVIYFTWQSQDIDWETEMSRNRDAFARSRSIDQQIDEEREKRQNEIQLLILGKSLIDLLLLSLWGNVG